ncbi:MAG: RNA 2',3'-cyclic phosphodiesterase [Candidatus Hodarchaeales archaeon]
MVRSFICVEVVNQVNIQKIEDILNELSSFQGIRPVKLNQLHITLKFLGEIPKKNISTIEEELNSINLPSFAMGFSHMGFFPNERRPRVIWIGISEGKSQLLTLATEVNTRLSLIGFPKEKRKFSPHLTLGRIKKHYPDEQESLVNYAHSSDILRGEKEVIQSFILKKSTLTPQGASYENLAEFSLKNNN